MCYFVRIYFEQYGYSPNNKTITIYKALTGTYFVFHLNNNLSGEICIFTHSPIVRYHNTIRIYIVSIFWLLLDERVYIMCLCFINVRVCLCTVHCTKRMWIGLF